MTKQSLFIGDDSPLTSVDIKKTVSNLGSDPTLNKLTSLTHIGSDNRIIDLFEKRKLKKAQKDFKSQRDNMSGVSLIGFQQMGPRLSPRPMSPCNRMGSPMSCRESPFTRHITLSEISQDQRGMEQFVQYCIKSSFINELLFWLNVEYSIKNDATSRAFQLRSVNILTKYLDTNTEYHVQIPSKALPKAFFKQIERKKDISKEVLSSAHDYVEKYIDEQVIPLFLKSRYADCLRERPSFLTASIPIQVRISGYKKHYETDKKYYLYELECLIEHEKIYLYKKFDDFMVNHRVLCSKYPSEKFPPIPARLLLRPETKVNAEKRMKDLSVYFESLLQMPAYVTHCKEMKDFLDTVKEEEVPVAGPST